MKQRPTLLQIQPQVPTSAGYPTVKKHSDTYQTKRGKANPIDMKSKWESGRTMGKTYMGPNSKWESGRTMGSTGP